MAWYGEHRRHSDVQKGIHKKIRNRPEHTPIEGVTLPEPGEFPVPISLAFDEKHRVLREINETGNEEEVIKKWHRWKEPKDKRYSSDYLWIIKDYRYDNNPSIKSYFVTKRKIPGENMRWATEDELDDARENIQGMQEKNGNVVRYQKPMDYEDVLYTESGIDYLESPDYRDPKDIKIKPEQTDDYKSAWELHKKRRIEELHERERAFNKKHRGNW